MINEADTETIADTNDIRVIANMVSAGFNRYLSAKDDVNQIGMLYLLSALALLNTAKDLPNNEQIMTTARRFASQGLSRAAKTK